MIKKFKKLQGRNVKNRLFDFVFCLIIIYKTKKISNKNWCDKVHNTRFSIVWFFFPIRENLQSLTRLHFSPPPPPPRFQNAKNYSQSAVYTERLAPVPSFHAAPCAIRRVSRHMYCVQKENTPHSRVQNKHDRRTDELAALRLAVNRRLLFSRSSSS